MANDDDATISLDVPTLAAPEKDLVRQDATAKKVEYDPRPPHDTAQRRIAYTLVGTLTAVIVISFAGLGFDWFSITELEALMTLIFGSLVGLVGAVTGFYYGGHTSGRT